MRGSSVLLPQTERACLLRRLAPVLVLAALTGACSSGPAPATFDLSAPTSRIRGAAGVQVLVNEPAALQQLATQQILVKDASGSVSFIGGGQWADNLPRLIQTRLINTFENSSQLRGVSRPSSGAVADVQLISELRRFEIATPDNAAVVEISVKIVSDRDGPHRERPHLPRRRAGERRRRPERRPRPRRGPVGGHARHRALGERKPRCRGARIPARASSEAKIGRRLRGRFRVTLRRGLPYVMHRPLSPVHLDRVQAARRFIRKSGWPRSERRIMTSAGDVIPADPQGRERRIALTSARRRLWIPFRLR